MTERRKTLYWEQVMADAAAMDSEARTALPHGTTHPLDGPAPDDAVDSWQTLLEAWLAGDVATPEQHRDMVHRCARSARAATLRAATLWVRTTTEAQPSTADVRELSRYVRAMPCAHLPPSEAMQLRVAARGGLRTVLGYDDYALNKLRHRCPLCGRTSAADEPELWTVTHLTRDCTALETERRQVWQLARKTAQDAGAMPPTPTGTDTDTYWNNLSAETRQHYFSLTMGGTFPDSFMDVGMDAWDAATGRNGGVHTGPKPKLKTVYDRLAGITGRLLVHVARKVNYVIQVATVDGGRGLAGPGAAGNGGGGGNGDDDDGGGGGDGGGDDGGAQHTAAADHHPARHIAQVTIRIGLYGYEEQVVDGVVTATSGTAVHLPGTTPQQRDAQRAQFMQQEARNRHQRNQQRTASQPPARSSDSGAAAAATTATQPPAAPRAYSILARTSNIRPPATLTPATTTATTRRNGISVAPGLNRSTSTPARKFGVTPTPEQLATTRLVGLHSPWTRPTPTTTTTAATAAAAAPTAGPWSTDRSTAAGGHAGHSAAIWNQHGATGITAAITLSAEATGARTATTTAFNTAAATAAARTSTTVTTAARAPGPQSPTGTPSTGTATATATMATVTAAGCSTATAAAATAAATATATAAATATASGQKTRVAGTVNSGVTSQDADGTAGNNQNAGARAQARHGNGGDTAVTALGTQRGTAGKRDAATQRRGRPAQLAAVGTAATATAVVSAEREAAATPAGSTQPQHGGDVVDDSTATTAVECAAGTGDAVQQSQGRTASQAMRAGTATGGGTTEVGAHTGSQLANGTPDGDASATGLTGTGTTVSSPYSFRHRRRHATPSNK